MFHHAPAAVLSTEPPEGMASAIAVGDLPAVRQAIAIGINLPQAFELFLVLATPITPGVVERNEFFALKDKSVPAVILGKTFVGLTLDGRQFQRPTDSRQAVAR